MFACCKYLGYTVGRGHKRPDNYKVPSIRDFPTPTTKSAVRSFLGLAGYYREFIPQFASNSSHLTDATRKSAPEYVEWTDALQAEFSMFSSIFTPGVRSNRIRKALGDDQTPFTHMVLRPRLLFMCQSLSSSSFTK